jgi:hypothetical protein
VTPHCTQEQLADLVYYTEASAADGKDTSTSNLLAQALTGNPKTHSDKDRAAESEPLQNIHKDEEPKGE